MIENALPDNPTPKPLKATPLDAWHRAHGARMVEFAGYAMPVQYQGVLAEHLHCRSQAALFDVSHMGQATLTGATAAAALDPRDSARTASRPPEQHRPMSRGHLHSDLLVLQARHGSP